MGRPQQLSEGAEASREALEAEQARLQNAVKHLKRSNCEVMEAQAEDSDPVLEEALQVCWLVGILCRRTDHTLSNLGSSGCVLQENLIVIQKYEHSLRDIDEALQALPGHSNS